MRERILAAPKLFAKSQAQAETLEEELTRAGHWPQPEPWVVAVVEETQLGHHYRVI